MIQTAEKKQITFVLSYMDAISTERKVKLQKLFKKLLPPNNTRMIFKLSSRMKIYFNFKDKIKQELPYLLVYNFKSIISNAEYTGKI